MTAPKPVRDVEASLLRALRILLLAFLAAPADPGRRRSPAVRRFAALARLAGRRHLPAKDTPTGRRVYARWAAGFPMVAGGVTLLALLLASTPVGAERVRLIKDINPGPASAGTVFAAQVDGVLLFTADDGTTGFELWKSDGTAAGTVLVKDISPGPAARSALTSRT